MGQIGALCSERDADSALDLVGEPALAGEIHGLQQDGLRSGMVARREPLGSWTSARF